MAKVIKTWKANEQADEHGTHVEISGRDAGLLSWVMSLVGLEPTDKLVVTNKRVEFTQSSITGKKSLIIPLLKINSTFYGYTKPLKTAIAILIFFVGLAYLMFAERMSSFNPLFPAWMPWITLLLGVVLSGVKYYFGKVLTIGFGDGQDRYSIEFKRSMIEQQNIDEQKAEYVCRLIQALIQHKIDQQTAT